MTAVDTSVAVPAIAEWHAAHRRARRAASGALIPVHAMLETYSVLTRLPPPHRVDGDVAARLLTGWFSPVRVLTPPARLARSLVERFSAAGVSGGGVYDGLVGLTASAHGLELVTRDRQAARTYDLLSVPHRVLDD